VGVFGLDHHGDLRHLRGWRHRRAAALFAYVGISVPVVGVGLLAELASLRLAGLVFAGLVALLALAALLLLGGTSTARRRRRLRSMDAEVRQ
jgi:hypothetical protein